MYRIPKTALRMVREGSVSVASRSVHDPDTAAKVAHAMIGRSPVERMIAIMVDTKGDITSVVQVAQGGMSAMRITVTEVMRAVMTSHAAAFILAHNHPSGDPTPSHDDVETTRAIARAGTMLGVSLLDHIVVTAEPSTWDTIGV